MQRARPQRDLVKPAIIIRYVGSLGRNANLGLMMLLGTTLALVTGQTAETPRVQPSSSVPTVDLHRGTVIRFSAPGPAAVATRIQCGPGGDVYAIYSSSTSLQMWSAPIRRVSISSRSVTEYAIPAISGYESLSRASFDVAANGTLYALLQAYPQSGSKSKSDPVYFIVKYKDDGQLDSYLTLGELPGKRIQPTSLALFADGSFLVSGTTIEKTLDGTSLGVFSAIFDQKGAFRAPVTLMRLDTPAESSGSPRLEGASTTTPQQNADEKEKLSRNAIPLASSLHSVSSSDGYIYIFQESGRLDIVSPVGSVEHEFKLRPPADRLSGVHMAAAGPGFLFIYYDHVATGEPGENSQYPGMISVVYPQSGEVTAIYRLPQTENEFLVPACAASPNDFLFLSADEQGFLEVVHYVP